MYADLFQVTTVELQELPDVSLYADLFQVTTVELQELPDVSLYADLFQVTTVELQELPGCSLLTLAHCSQLKHVSITSSALWSTNGLENCKQLRYVNLSVCLSAVYHSCMYKWY